MRDQSLLPEVQQAAELILDQYPDRVRPLIERWVGVREEYINA
jgi:ATP-dependent DNA helicase RecG